MYIYIPTPTLIHASDSLVSIDSPFTNMCVHIHVSTHTHTHTYMYTFVYIYYVSTYTYVRVIAGHSATAHSQIAVCVYLCLHIHQYICTYIHAYAQVTVGHKTAIDSEDADRPVALRWWRVAGECR